MKTLKYFLLCFALCLPYSLVTAEDIELYVGNNIQRQGENAQVLIIFDTSGSMDDQETVVLVPYDSTVSYPSLDNEPSSEYIYYSTSDSSSVPSINSSRRFLKNNNSCAVGQSILDEQGVYLGNIEYYRPPYSYWRNSGRGGRWVEVDGEWRNLPDSGFNSPDTVSIVDCLDDVTQLNNKNSSSLNRDGYPSNDSSLMEDDDDIPYKASVDTDFPVVFNNGVTLYSRNYIRWRDGGGITSKSRMDIAKETVIRLINSSPSVDYGLMTFNYNYYNNGSSNNGGRVVFGIDELTDSKRTNLTDLIDDDLSAYGSTPLCESLYEAAQYFGGKAVEYGNKNRNPTLTPGSDSSVVDDGVYISPFKGCSNEIHVILMTDGQPQNDGHADSKIQGLDGYQYISDEGYNNYLPSLARWMHTQDINPNIDGKQIANLYTIGFGQDAIDDAGQLLTIAAREGGGTYYPAASPDDLLNSLQSALLDILKVNTTFTSPSISSNNFDRTETLDSVYYAMFLPERGPRWTGNIKKLKLIGGKQVDRDDELAIDNDGSIAASAKTFWSTETEPDGPEVEQGGVLEMLQKKNDRNILSDIGEDGLVSLSYDSLVEAELHTPLATAMSVDVDDLEGKFNWFLGQDIYDDDDDGDTTDNRPDIFADPLHSKPLVINYGGTSSEQDVRIIVGTNAGALHMFQDTGDDVDENWAIMPQEFFPNIERLIDNDSADTKIYGIDGTATAYIYDDNGDGSIVADDGDKAWIFVGLRRGGSSYYAFDVSDPDSPVLLWHINNQTDGFADLGQSWSKPKVMYSKINIDDGVVKPVLFFGGGYDVNKDKSGPGTTDSKGTALYMVDAYSGDLLWSATPTANKFGKNTIFSGITDSIPASVAVMDSDSDGFADRLYASDTGANIWRVDMPGDDPNDEATPWSIFKFASFGGITNETDLRFFSEPSVARGVFTITNQTEIGEETIITRQDKAFDAVMIGSGDRSKPASADTQDYLFLIRDPNIFTTSMDSENIPDTVTISDLYDYTNNPYESTSDVDALDLKVSEKQGWYMELSDTGEKSLSAPTAIAGVGYYTTFEPADDNAESIAQCKLNTGEGYLYAFDIATGKTVYNWRKLEIGDRIPDTPTVVIPPTQSLTDKSSKIRFVGVGEGDGEGTITLCDAENCDQTKGISLKTMRTYMYIEEDEK